MHAATRTRGILLETWCEKIQKQTFLFLQSMCAFIFGANSTHAVVPGTIISRIHLFNPEGMKTVFCLIKHSITCHWNMLTKGTRVKWLMMVKKQTIASSKLFYPRSCWFALSCRKIQLVVFFFSFCKILLFQGWRREAGPRKTIHTMLVADVASVH